MKKRLAVIMAGGSGERFWPLSRKQNPKQLLKITNPDKSLLQDCVDRTKPVLPADCVYVITGRNLVEPIRKGDISIPSENVVGEPCKRNTAGCLIYAAAHLMATAGKDPDDIVMGILTADQQTREPAKFQQALQTAFEAAENTDSLVTMGVKPTRAETGYGYIEVGSGSTSLGTDPYKPVFEVVRFREKPDRETANRFLASGCFYWNSGMFFWKISSFLRELKNASPQMHKITLQITEALRAGDQSKADHLFSQLDTISIDYALLEKAENVLVVPVEFDWDDVGAWDALERTFEKDESGNICIGNPVTVDSKDCIIYNAPGAAEKAVSVIGASNMIVVVADDAVLVMPKNKAQDVKTAVNILKERNAGQL